MDILIRYLFTRSNTNIYCQPSADKMAKAMRSRAIEKTDRQSGMRDIVAKMVSLSRMDTFRISVRGLGCLFGWKKRFDTRTDRNWQNLCRLVRSANGMDDGCAAKFGNAAARRLRRRSRVLWITPLRALATDLQAALLQVVRDLELPWSVECRTGDTAASVRNRQKKRLPTALVTTPESLNLLLSYPAAREKFNNLRLVVVDEWHELMGSKRGVMVEVALARLRSWTPRLKIWGLSATMGNTETAMSVLLGDAAGQWLSDPGIDGQIFGGGIHCSPTNGAVSLGRTSWTEAFTTGVGENSVCRKHIGIYQHPIPGRNMVPGNFRGTSGLGRSLRPASRLLKPQ